MNYEYLERLKKIHPAWRLLNADSAPLVISFFEIVFIRDGIRSVSEPDLEERLENYIRSIQGEDIYPRTAREYLDDWADDSRGWLRKYYPKIGDEAEFDITPATEKAIEWIRGFEKKEFAATESRLLLIFQMLRDLVSSTETDPKKRIEELEQRKRDIDSEISAIENGIVNTYDIRQIKESLWRIEEEIRDLMTDFREVEENFRTLDRQTREKIAAGSDTKSKVLDEIFHQHDSIENSDQGKSFTAFWHYLMSRSRQDELDAHTEKILNLESANEIAGYSAISGMKYNLLDAGDRVKRTLNNLNEQLRTFLDEKLWLENRRIMELIQSVEEKALAIRTAPPPEKNFFEIDDISPEIELPMERRLYTPPEKPPAFQDIPAEGAAADIPDTLYNQYFVDEIRLLDNIRRKLVEKNQVSLKELCETFPVEKGLSEILTYMLIAARQDDAVINTDEEQQITYSDDEITRSITLPLVIFTG